MNRISLQLLFLGILFLAPGQTPAQAKQPPIPAPDVRYKADILVVVAHPDDDTAIATYLAKAVLDEGKRAAIVFTNRGDSGPNAVGMEQAKALADVREMEARRSLAALGITNVWFLHGQDTPTQDVLHSLETLGHGQALEDTVRIVRLTRPEVILTWLPAYVAGENHGDHQAAGVIAVEAFDSAADPAIFPEQLAIPRAHAGIGNYGEGLRPWQSSKLYFFSDSSHPEFLKGRGPVYQASDISRVRKVSFATLNRELWKEYATQLDFDQSTLEYFVNMPEYLVLGKSLVPSAVDADVWSGIGAAPAPVLPQPANADPPSSGISLQPGGPWAFYRDFYPAHRLEHLGNLIQPQTALSWDHQLWMPLLLRNNSAAPADVMLHLDAPAGWSGDVADRAYHLDPGSTYPIQLFLGAPSASGQQSPQTLTWTASDGGGAVGKFALSVYLEFDGVPQ